MPLSALKRIAEAEEAARKDLEETANNCKLEKLKAEIPAAATRPPGASTR